METVFNGVIKIIKAIAFSILGIVFGMLFAFVMLMYCLAQMAS